MIGLSGSGIIQWDADQLALRELRNKRDFWRTSAEELSEHGSSELAGECEYLAINAEEKLEELKQQIAARPMRQKAGTLSFPLCPGQKGDAPSVPASPTNSNVVDLSTRTGDARAKVPLSPSIAAAKASPNQFLNGEKK